MPAIHPHIGGAAGTNHGSDYRIADPVLACVTSAKIQVAAAAKLLENGAARAKTILANTVPVYPSIKEFLAATDRVDFDREVVYYSDNGNVSLTF